MLFSIFACLTIFSVVTNAQTTTVVNAAGQTVVEVLTTDFLGNPLTQTILTMTSTSPPLTTSSTTTSPTTTATTTTTPNDTPPQGPVGQPASTTATAGAPTPYTYTTTIDGVTTRVVATFIPTNPSTTPLTASSTGTVWGYNTWSSAFLGPASSTGKRVGSTGLKVRERVPLYGLLIPVIFTALATYQ